MDFYLQNNSVENSLICPRAKSSNQYLTKSFSIYQNKHWTIRRWDDHSMTNRPTVLNWRLSDFWLSSLLWFTITVQDLGRQLLCVLSSALRTEKERRGSDFFWNPFVRTTDYGHTKAKSLILCCPNQIQIQIPIPNNYLGCRYLCIKV